MLRDTALADNHDSHHVERSVKITPVPESPALVRSTKTQIKKANRGVRTARSLLWQARIATSSPVHPAHEAVLRVLNPVPVFNYEALASCRYHSVDMFDSYKHMAKFNRYLLDTKLCCSRWHDEMQHLEWLRT